jgi:hypothetical protein
MFYFNNLHIVSPLPPSILTTFSQSVQTEDETRNAQDNTHNDNTHNDNTHNDNTHNDNTHNDNTHNDNTHNDNETRNNVLPKEFEYAKINTGSYIHKKNLTILDLISEKSDEACVESSAPCVESCTEFKTAFTSPEFYKRNGSSSSMAKSEDVNNVSSNNVVTTNNPTQIPHTTTATTTAELSPIIVRSLAFQLFGFIKQNTFGTVEFFTLVHKAMEILEGYDELPGEVKKQYLLHALEELVKGRDGIAGTEDDLITPQTFALVQFFVHNAPVFGDLLGTLKAIASGKTKIAPSIKRMQACCGGMALSMFKRKKNNV